MLKGDLGGFFDASAHGDEYQMLVRNLVLIKLVEKIIGVGMAHVRKSYLRVMGSGLLFADTEYGLKPQVVVLG